ncbi:MAG: nitrate reductase cytochrome c-type subunit [Desulfobulbaceae bacterium]|nr:nitrate reductase cytochrome c-type subunit [Desulfobulbaceae bacterium]
MKKNICVGLALVVGCIVIVPQGVLADEVKGLRGAIGVETPQLPPKLDKQIPDQKSIKRDFAQQPPLIPHKIDDYSMTRSSNDCMGCHGGENYKAAGATKVSATHYVDRDGRELAELSPRQYFCTQCHVVQMDAKPLVENTFKSAPARRK